MLKCIAFCYAIANDLCPVSNVKYMFLTVVKCWILGLLYHTQIVPMAMVCWTLNWPAPGDNKACVEAVVFIGLDTSHLPLTKVEHGAYYHWSSYTSEGDKGWVSTG